MKIRVSLFIQHHEIIFDEKKSKNRPVYVANLACVFENISSQPRWPVHVGKLPARLPTSRLVAGPMQPP